MNKPVDSTMVHVDRETKLLMLNHCFRITIISSFLLFIFCLFSLRHFSLWKKNYHERIYINATVASFLQGSVWNEAIYRQTREVYLGIDWVRLRPRLVHVILVLHVSNEIGCIDVLLFPLSTCPRLSPRYLKL